MKFTWFNLMPWPYLPDDFREKNRSVWVDIDQRLFDPVKSHEVYNTYLDLLEYAADVGFDAIGCNEHHQNGYGIMPSPNIMILKYVCISISSHLTGRSSLEDEGGGGDSFRSRPTNRPYKLMTL